MSATGVSPWVSTAASLERPSEHPLARGIVERARSEGIIPTEAQSFEALTGVGTKAVLKGETWYLGSPDLFRSLGVEGGMAEEAAHRLQEEGKTVVCVGNPEKVKGLIALQDQIRPGMREIIADLHAMGLKVVMLTGDHLKTAQAVARAVGIDEVRAGLKPDEKVQAVKELEAAHGALLMVGDGVNDAPALAAATCGMAMGAAGSDAAIEAADVALMADDLAKVAEALHLGRKARRISAQNIAFSILLLAALIPAALTGALSVAAAVLIHEGSELLAVANGLRVRWFS